MTKEEMTVIFEEAANYFKQVEDNLNKFAKASKAGETDKAEMYKDYTTERSSQLGTLVVLMQKLGIYEQYVEWYKERKEVEKALAELPQGYQLITPEGETEKSYKICTGSNGCVTRGNVQYFYCYVAKKLCKVIDGKIYAPFWAIK